MPIKAIFMFLTVVIATFSIQQARAVGCGDVITANTTLMADLECNTGSYAIEIGADNVTLNLNGHNISGTSDLVGVIIVGRSNVNILGNGGVISGFWAGVNTADTDSLHIQKTSFYDLGVGVVISSGSHAIIKNNDFIQLSAQGVVISNSVVGKVANNNTVNNNEFFKTRVGIEICGDDSDRNRISNNLIWLSRNFGIRIMRSDRNTIYNNRILDTTETAIRIDDSSRNRLWGNSLRVGDRGLEIYAKASEACLNTGPTISRRNKFNGNHAFEFETGLLLGLSRTTSGQVRNNDLTGNKLYDNTTGIVFNTDAHNNDASVNAFTGTAIPVTDFGEDNMY